MSATPPSESAPLLPDVERAKPEPTRRIRAVIHAALSAIFVLTLVLVLFFLDDGKSGSWLSGQLPKDPILAAQEVLKVAPVIVRLFTFHFSKIEAVRFGLMRFACGMIRMDT